MRAVESDSVESVRNAKDKLHKSKYNHMHCCAEGLGSLVPFISLVVL